MEPPRRNAPPLHRRGMESAAKDQRDHHSPPLEGWPEGPGWFYAGGRMPPNRRISDKTTLSGVLSRFVPPVCSSGLLASCQHYNHPLRRVPPVCSSGLLASCQHYNHPLHRRGMESAAKNQRDRHSPPRRGGPKGRGGSTLAAGCRQAKQNPALRWGFVLLGFG